MIITSFKTIERQSLSESVFRQLWQRIVSQELPPGSRLPGERTLAETFGVNRSAVREALKRLQQAGLIEVRHGGVSRVLDYREECGLELLASLIVDLDGNINNEVVRSIMGMRSAMAPEIAAAAARRADAALSYQLERLVQRMRIEESDLRALQNHSLAFWKALVDYSDNIAFRLAFNSMSKTYLNIKDVMARVLEAEFRDIAGLTAIAAAVRRKEPEAAARAARLHVDIGRTALEGIIDSLGTSPPANTMKTRFSTNTLQLFLATPFLGGAKGSTRSNHEQ